MGIVIAILAADEKGGIGKDNKLPWPRNDGDMAFFYRMTKGHPVVMGRNTWDSLPEAVRPLKLRDNYVLTSQETPTGAYKAPNEGIARLGEVVFVIGGVGALERYKEEIDAYAITSIKGEYDCDVYFNQKALWVGSVHTREQVEVEIGYRDEVRYKALHNIILDMVEG